MRHDVNAYVVKNVHTNPDGSVGVFMTKKDAKFSISDEAEIIGTIYVGSDATIEGARISENVLIGASVTIKEGSSIGKGSTIRSRAVICCLARIGSFCTIGPDSSVGYNTCIGDNIRVMQKQIVPAGMIIFACDGLICLERQSETLSL